nr:serine/threonine-protein kinase [Kibdelosporangium sp. MJ126-NF4]CEL22550.1 serine/threonine protein kinase [Kibdelosporangium sp. MJ126-NF4]CTQ89406.1 serine/threonine protein kinase [Kibdelosporangium sp. MJ126-NF4]
MQRIVGDRYELVRPLGRGGMGEVWLGRDHRLDREVAVKLLRPSVLPVGADVETLISRFNREARMTAKLENPGVPAVYDTGTDEDDLYLVMQLIGGADLAEFQAENEPVPVAWVVAIGAQITSVLAAAHSAGLVHRDLKPRNVMITESGEIKVLDFGIALLRDVDMTRITRTSEAVGTPAYMAPEQAMHGQSSPSVDLYSLGCVLYELLTGRYVFEATTALAMMHRHYADTPQPVLSLRTDTGPPLADLVGRLLAKRPELRPASAIDVYDVLMSLMPPVAAGGPLIPMDPTRPFRDKLTIPRPPVALSGFSSAPPPVRPVDPPTMPATRPVRTPPPLMPPMQPVQSMPFPYPPPVAMRPVDSSGRRIGEGVLLAFACLVVGFSIDEWVIKGAVVQPYVMALFVALPTVFGLRMRKRRLGLRYYWSPGPFGRNALPPRHTTVGERILERFLVGFGGVCLIAAVAQPALITAAEKGEGRNIGFIGMLTVCLVMLIPGLLMRQRRLGRRYPWIV